MTGKARSRYYFLRTRADGRREISWRVWVLVWVLPVLFLLAGAGMLGLEAYRHLATVPTEGEVVRVYAWEGETIFDRGTTNYGPVFRYTWSDGETTEASVGMSHPDWNFEVGSVHPIRYFPTVKTNVVLPGRINFYAGAIILGIGLVFALPAIWASLRLWRWRAAGA